MRYQVQALRLSEAYNAHCQVAVCTSPRNVYSYGRMQILNEFMWVCWVFTTLPKKTCREPQQFFSFSLFLRNLANEFVCTRGLQLHISRGPKQKCFYPVPGYSAVYHKLEHLLLRGFIVPRRQLLRLGGSLVIPMELVVHMSRVSGGQWPCILSQSLTGHR